MAVEQRTGAFNKVRFNWKKDVFASHTLSRSAKLMAAYLCDNFVNKHSGCCWPKNDTLAQNLALSKRSVQRHMGELISEGWLRHVKIKNARRALQIAFPNQAKGDTEHDVLSPSSMTKPSFKGDTTVIPYKNQVNNQGMRRVASDGFTTVLVGEREAGILKGWKDWLDEHTNYETKMVFELLRKKGAYLFPVRFPKDEEAQIYNAYFDAAIASNGFKNSEGAG